MFVGLRERLGWGVAVEVAENNVTDSLKSELAETHPAATEVNKENGAENGAEDCEKHSGAAGGSLSKDGSLSKETILKNGYDSSPKPQQGAPATVEAATLGEPVGLKEKESVALLLESVGGEAKPVLIARESTEDEKSEISPSPPFSVVRVEESSPGAEVEGLSTGLSRSEYQPSLDFRPSTGDPEEVEQASDAETVSELSAVLTKARSRAESQEADGGWTPNLKASHSDATSPETEELGTTLTRMRTRADNATAEDSVTEQLKAKKAAAQTNAPETE
eukprot:gene31281-39306_t